MLQLPMDPNPDAARAGGSTPLLRASRNGHEHVARLLLEAGAEKDATDSDGCTALMGAADEGHPSVRLLLEAGANTELLDIRGKTALSDGN